MAPKIEDNSLNMLKDQLAAGKLGQVYIFHGEEAYLREHYLGEIKRALIPASFEQFNYHRLDGKTLTMQQLTETAEAMPMMAERTMIVVYDCDLFKLPDEARTVLMALLNDFPDYCCLIFVYTQTEYKENKTYKKLCAALEKAQVVLFPAQDLKKLTGWVARRFRAAGHEIGRQEAEHLIFRCGELMNDLIPEIEKISAYARHEQITVQDIDAVSEPIISAVVFDMTRAVSNGKYDRAAELLGGLLKKQEQPIAILAALSMELRRLYTARLALDGGKDRLWLMDLWGIRFDSQARALLDAARRTTREWCRESLKLCRTLDQRMKSEVGIDREGELKLMLMQLAQRR